jgi:hypothetical protein
MGYEKALEQDPYETVIAAVRAGRVVVDPDFSVTARMPDEAAINERSGTNADELRERAKATAALEDPAARDKTAEEIADDHRLRAASAAALVVDDDLLRTIGAKIAVYRAAGYEMVPTSDAMRLRAGQLANILSVIAGSDEAPKAMVAQATPAIDAWLGAWEFVLEGILQLKPRAAERVLSSLLASHPQVSPRFHNPSADQLKRANEVLANYTVVHGRPGSKAKLTAWGVAVKFAAAFGLTMDPKRSAATRPPKTKRKRTRKTKRTRAR